VNAQRSEKGLLVVNSLWFWGGGELPQAVCQTDCDLVISDDPLTQGLARLCAVEVQPDDAATDVIKGGGNNILWQTQMKALQESDSEVFAPLLAMLRESMLAELVIDIPGIGRWRIERRALRRWWRRRKSLAELLKGNV
jgi:hypothetical protein